MEGQLVDGAIGTKGKRHNPQYLQRDVVSAQVMIDRREVEPR